MNEKKRLVKNKVMVVGINSPLYKAFVERLIDESFDVVVEKEEYKSVFTKKDVKTSLRKLSANKLKRFDCNYTVAIFDNLFAVNERNIKRTKAKIKKAVDAAERSSAKTLFILPFYKTDLTENIEKLSLERIKNAGLENVMVVYVGQVVKEGRVDEFISQLFERVVEEGKLILPVGLERFYLTNSEVVVDRLMKVLFSFSDEGKKSAVISEGRDIGEMIDVMSEVVPDLQVVADERVSLKASMVDDIIRVDRLSDKEIKLLLRGFVKKKIKGVKIKRKEKENSVTGGFNILKQEGPFKGKTRLFIVLIITVLVFPYLALSATFPFLLSGKYFFEKGNLSTAEKAVNISNSAAAFTDSLLVEYASLPLIGVVYKKTSADISVFAKLLKTTSLVLRVVSLGKNVALNVYGMGETNVVDVSKNMVYDLSDIYENLGLVQSQYGESILLAKLLKKKGVDDKLITYVRNKASAGKDLVSNIPPLLGEKGPKRYLIIFQNNLEIRPTGGFIGSFALADFEDMNLKKLEVFDIYSADGQLKGYVEPPPPIDDYLNSNSWYMRDANWNPDFAESAKTIEWFLEKETKSKVDGVIALDLEAVKDIIEVFGEVRIKDLDRTIKPDDFYQITQYELDREFFPGSRKKKNLLTFLYQELMDMVVNSDSAQQVQIGRSLYSNLEKRHIQIFLNDREFQRPVDALGWGGGFYIPECFSNCYSDWVNIVEANFGVNKANKFVEKDAALEVVVDEEKVERSITISLTNNGSKKDAPVSYYKTYLRILVPKDSYISPFEVISSEDRKLLEPEIYLNDSWKEAGVLLSVNPQETLLINTSWKTESGLDFSSEGSYSFYWRKQAGIVSDDIKLSLGFPDAERVQGSSGFLTEGNTISYNTELLRDFVSLIYW